MNAELRALLAALPELLPLAFDAPAVLARRAAQRAGELLAALAPQAAAQLDFELRDGWFGHRWRDLTAEGAGALGHLGEHAWVALTLASCHASGWVRAAALLGLAQNADARVVPHVLPFALMRANDWVGAVRAGACALLERWLVPAHAADWVRCLSLVLQLGEQRRGDHRRLIEGVLALLREPGCRGALLAAAEFGDRAVRRASVGVLLESTVLDPGELQRGLREGDLVVRLLWARRALELLGGEPRVALLRQLEADPSAAVRAEALRAASDGSADTLSRCTLERALCDRSPALRALARRVLTDAREVREVQLAALRSGTPRLLEGALLGLVESGAASDVGLVAPLAEHPRVRVRAAALRTLGALAGEPATPRLWAALEDSSPRVAREAGIALRRLRVGGREGLPCRTTALQPLQALFERARRPHTRQQAFALAQELERWEELGFLLWCAGRGDAEWIERAVAALDRWLVRSNRAVLQASAAQLRSLQCALGGAAPALPSDCLRQLRFLLGWLERTVGPDRGVAD